MTKKEHEIDASLNKITDYVQLLYDKYDEIEEIKKYIEQNNKEIERVNNYLIENLSERNDEIEIVKDKIKETHEEIVSVRNVLEQKVSEKDKDIEKQTFKKIEGVKDKFNQIILERENEIKDLKAELERTVEQITIDKKDLDYAISSKDAIIEKLEKDLEAKIEEINELSFKIFELTDKLNTYKIQFPENEGSTVVLINRIKQIMEFKGFMSDKEFELLLEKISRNEIEVNL